MLEKLEFDLRQTFKPRPIKTVVEWSEENLYLGESQSQIPGPYNTMLTPYIREPLNCFSDAQVSDLVLCFGTQTSKTTMIMAGTAWKIVNSPTPIVWGMPNEKLARWFSENRWQPIVDHSPALKAQKPLDPDKFKITSQQFTRCTLDFVGSNSPSNLAMRGAGLLNLDELDKFKQATEKEASAKELAEERTKTFTNPLRVKTSTPTTDRGPIWLEFLAGDQRYYFVPCPHCQAFQKLEWRQVKWDQAAKTDRGWVKDFVRNSAYYECEQCGGHIQDHHKTTMLRVGEWRPTNKMAERGKRSYHLNSLYAPWASCSFGTLAVKFLEGKETLIGLQNFTNSTLAEPWHVNEEMDYVTIERSTGFKLLDKWEEEETRFMGVDVQKSDFRYVCRAFAADGSSRLMDCGTLPTWDDVKAKQMELGVSARRLLVDCAYNTAEVYLQCCRFGWTAFRGDDREMFKWIVKNGQTIEKPWSPVTWQDPLQGMHREAALQAKATLTQHLCPVIRWSNPTIKDILNRVMKQEFGAWLVPDNTPLEWHEQINAEIKKEKRSPVDGSIKWEWVQVKPENHLRDCELMITVCAMQNRLLRPKSIFVDNDTTTNGNS